MPNLSRPALAGVLCRVALPPRLLPVLLILLLGLSGCATRQPETLEKYRGDEEEMMSSYTPRDDGLPLTPPELHAFKTVSDLDRGLSEEDARIVELHFKYFVHQHRRTFERFLQRSSRFLPYIKKIFIARGIPEDIAYLCMIESGGNPIARSPAGAAGLWQFMPFTGRKFGLTQNNWIDERRDPYKATYAASDYLLKLYGDFDNWHLAIAAYNAGEGKIGRAVTGTGAADFFDLCRLDGALEEKARLKNETRDYVPRLIAVAKIMRNLKRLGFSEPGPEMAWDLRPVNVPPGTNLSGLAKELGLNWEEFSGMNPAFRRTASPPASPSTAYVPPDKTVTAVNWMAGSQAKAYAGWREYTVKKGDSLASIAKRHKVSVTSLKEANGIAKLPPRGSVIMIPGKGASQPVFDARPAKSGGGAATYTVRPGDTLSSLSRAWGTDVTSIRRANSMGDKETSLKVGQRLSIPGKAGAVKGSGKTPVAKSASKPEAKKPAAQASAKARNVTVKSGDTLYSIARANNVSVQALQKANGLGSSTALKIGQRLVIP